LGLGLAAAFFGVPAAISSAVSSSSASTAAEAAAAATDQNDGDNDQQRQQRRRNYNLINSFAGNAGQIRRMTGTGEGEHAQEEKIIWVRDPYQNLERVVKRAIADGQQKYTGTDN
jgi:hypothetical protein